MYWNINANASPSPAPSTDISVLNDLSDVAIASPAEGDILIFKNGNFENNNIIDGTTTDLININANNISTGTLNIARLPYLAESLNNVYLSPYIESMTAILSSGNQTIEIIGINFTPVTQLEIPGVIINSLQVVSPRKIIANITTNNLSGNIAVTITNGPNSNIFWADGIKNININADIFFNNVLLFLKGNGLNNSTSIVDDSNHKRTINRFGNTAISTAQAKYSSSIYFDGREDYLNIPLLSIDFTGDFTAEAWIYFLDTSWATFLAGDETGNTEFTVASSLLGLARSYVAWDLQFSHSTSLNTWNHFAYSRQNGLLRIFKNGILIHSLNYPTNIIVTSNLFIGRDYGGNRQFKGYLSHLRISNIARYTANFNAETDTYLN